MMASDWEESSSEDDESSDSNTEELPVEDKNIVVSVSILKDWFALQRYASTVMNQYVWLKISNIPLA